MVEHAHKQSWRRWWVDASMVAALVLVCAALAVSALGQGGAPVQLLPTLQPPLVRADASSRLSAGGTAGLTTPASVRLRPLRSTTLRVGIVNPASPIDKTAVGEADVDLIAAWAQGDLGPQLGPGWASHRGVAWRTDTWRLVDTRRLVLGVDRLSVTRLANRHTQRWLWVAVLPRARSVRSIQRELAAQLRPQRTPWLVVGSSGNRFSGGGLRVLHVDREGAGLRVGRVRVPAV